MNLFLSLAVFLCTGASAPDKDALETDKVVLNSGKTLKGHVVYEDDEILILRKGTKDREIPMEKIDDVTSRARGIRAFAKEVSAFEPWRPEDNEELAKRATELGLEAEARILWWRVIASQPSNPRAHEALGHRKSGKSWRIEHAGRKVRLGKIRDVAKDFGKGWEFSTSHFDLRSNLSLEETLDLALDLELLYVAFFGLFGKELHLYETEERMLVHVHADDASFPERAGEDGYFVGQANLMTANASNGLVMHLIVHEIVHQLIYNTAVEERLYKGAIPDWVDEGLAEYIASASAGSAPGRLRIDTEIKRRDTFRIQATAKKPLSLSRVLNLSKSDFNASTKRLLKYAQVYTLIHFCLHGGEDEEYRKDFMEFMRSAYLGRGSSTDFKRAFELKKNKGFEESWKGYVLQMSG